MESVSSFYKEEPYFPRSDKYLEPQAWLSYDEQQRLLRYHNSQNKRGLSYANRSTPLHDLSRLPHTPEHQEDFGAPENGVNAEVFCDDGTYGFPASQISAGWTCRRPADQIGSHRQDVSYNGHRHVSPWRSKSKEGARKTLGHYEHLPSWDGNPQVLDYNPILADGRRQNFRPMSADIIEGPPISPVSSAYYYDVYRDTTRFPPSGNSSMWHPWSDVSRPLDRSVAMSPSSPLDSGLSSQSVASTPNSELEPLSSWDQPSADVFDDGLQKSYSDSCNGRQWSCPSEMYTVTPQTAQRHSNNSRTNLNRTFPHPSPRSCRNNLHSPPNSGMHKPDANSSFGENSPHKNTVHPKCYSSAESISDSYELRNVSWTLLSEKRERGNNDNYYSADNVDSNNQFDRMRAYHSTSTSDEASESTLKESSANCSILSPECKDVDDSGAPGRTNTEQHLQRETGLELPSEDAELLYQKQRIKNAKETEKALCELEEIYNQLNLDDFDLLDRADRRDLLSSVQQVMAGDSYKNQPLTRSKSDTFYEIFGRAYGIGYSKSPRAPPLRRAGIPDRVADDMALRKQQKPVTKFGKPVSSPSSYMLYSSHFTPSIPPVVKDFPFVNKPDVEYDDLSYRKYFQPRAYHELRQPPFGIPLHPTVQCPNSNYLHATPSSTPRALCHARGNPDVVRDDMAFRNLRKESATLCSR